MKEAALRQQLAEVQALLKKMADDGKAGSDRFVKAAAVEKDIADLLEHHGMELLELGAVARLLVSGELQAVLPLDNEALLDAAKPRLKNGEVVPDSAAKAARQDAMVRRLLKAAPLALAVLGGAHDLTASVQRVTHPWSEYVRVTVQAYSKMNK
jgi:peptide subunit release factor 1 (eRF1)